jgi:hypothetical protein
LAGDHYCSFDFCSQRVFHTGFSLARTPQLIIISLCFAGAPCQESVSSLDAVKPKLHILSNGYNCNGDLGGRKRWMSCSRLRKQQG